MAQTKETGASATDGAEAIFATLLIAAAVHNGWRICTNADPMTPVLSDHFSIWPSAGALFAALGFSAARILSLSMQRSTAASRTKGVVSFWVERLGPISAVVVLSLAMALSLSLVLDAPATFGLFHDNYRAAIAGLAFALNVSDIAILAPAIFPLWVLCAAIQANLVLGLLASNVSTRTFGIVTAGFAGVGLAMLAPHHSHLPSALSPLLHWSTATAAGASFGALSTALFKCSGRPFAAGFISGLSRRSAILYALHAPVFLLLTYLLGGPLQSRGPDSATSIGAFIGSCLALALAAEAVYLTLRYVLRVRSFAPEIRAAAAADAPIEARKDGEAPTSALGDR